MKSVNSWIYDEFDGNAVVNLGSYKTLYSDSSKYQQIEIVETENFGRVLLTDGRVASSSADEAVYHEMLVHVPLFSHAMPLSVLVIGGADGGAVREVIRHESARKVVVVEKDELLVQACVRYLPDISYALDDLRVDMKLMEPSVFFSSCDEKFDVVIIDPKNRSDVVRCLSSSSFCLSAAEFVKDDGIMVFPVASPFTMAERVADLMTGLRNTFEKLHVYTAPGAVMKGGVYGFGFASGKYCPFEDFNEERLESSGLVNSYYNKGTHRTSFDLPENVKGKFAGILDGL